MDNSDKRFTLGFFGPVGIYMLAAFSMVMTYLGSPQAAMFLALAVIWATTGTKLRHDELRAEIATLRTQLAALQRPADQAPERG